MTDEQFKQLIEKLEEIRCGLIDVETVIEEKWSKTKEKQK